MIDVIRWQNEVDQSLVSWQLVRCNKYHLNMNVLGYAAYAWGTMGSRSTFYVNTHIDKYLRSKYFLLIIILLLSTVLNNYVLINIY